MNTVVNFGKEPMMSSKQISELVGSRHDKVKQSMERLARSGVIGFYPIGVEGTGGRNGTIYMVNERNSYVVVAQLSPEFTAQLVDEWKALKEQKPQLPDFTNPAAAARAWATEFEQKQELQQQIEEQAPKIEVYEAIAMSLDDECTTDVAKTLGTNAKELNVFLRAKGVKQKQKDRPIAGYEPWFNVHDVPINFGTKIVKQCKITPLGKIEIAKLWIKEQKKQLEVVH